MSDFVASLDQLIANRKANPVEGSYTNSLLDDPARAAQKVGEEATETIIAGLAQSDERLVDEAADLVYHLLVLLHTRDIGWQQVLEQLQTRHR